MDSNFDPLSPDAPLDQLLSLRHNPQLAEMTTEELTALVQKIRTIVTSPPTLSAELSKDSERVSPKKRQINEQKAKERAVLANL